jgi:sugar/nucleoside kinase (ribokinase family)
MNFPFKIREDTEFDAVGFGTNAVDYLMSVPEYPRFDSKIELTEYSQFAGGEVASTMAGLQRLGMRTAYAGRFGDDQAGNFGLKTLVDEGVNTDFSEQIPGANTQIAFIIIDERNGERTIIWKRDPLLSFSVEEASDAIAVSGSILHFTPHDTAACIKLATLARAAGTLVSIDVDRILDGVGELLPLVDILICSADFTKNFTGISDPRSATRDLYKRFGSSVIGTTLGQAGSLVFCNNEFIETNGFAVPGGCKDTTGAGDAFRTGMLFGVLSGWSVETSCRSANAVAALKCRSVGARTALPTDAELREFLKV